MNRINEKSQADLMGIEVKGGRKKEVTTTLAYFALGFTKSKFA